MALHRFFVSAGPDGGAPTLADRDVHHLRDVLRMRAGEEVVLAYGGERQVEARIASVGPGGVTFEVIREIPIAFEPEITLAQGLSRGPKMDLLVQKATEIGVRRIVPFVASRTVVQLDASARRERVKRWRRIAEEAAKQSQRAIVPEIDDIIDITDLPDALAGADAVLVPWEESYGIGVGEALGRDGVTSRSRVAVVVGPEGGLAEAEVEILEKAGATAVTLGPNILRTETAGIVAAALASYELGGMGGKRRD